MRDKAIEDNFGIAINEALNHIRDKCTKALASLEKLHPGHEFGWQSKKLLREILEYIDELSEIIRT